MKLQIENFIDGKFITPRNGTYLNNHNPATGEVITKIPNSDSEDVELAVKAAQSATSWADLPRIKRVEWLRKIAKGLELRKDDIAVTESMDTGKPISLAKRVDASRSVANFEFFAEHAEKLVDEEYEMADAINYVIRKPVGVVGLITPWNLPLYLLTWKIAPALVMGNTIVAKPSELTPLTANLLCEVLTSIQFPSGVINVIHGLGPSAGQAILEHPQIKAISFTGGTSTGKIVAQTAAPMFKKLSLELGGKNATIILDDADLPTAAKGAARAAFAIRAVCLCGSRILIDSKIYDDFMTLLIKEVKAMKVGNPAEENTDIGSVFTSSHGESTLIRRFSQTRGW